MLKRSPHLSKFTKLAVDTHKRPPVRSYGDKGTGFGLGEVARFKGRPLNAGPVIEKKRAQR